MFPARQQSAVYSIVNEHLRTTLGAKRGLFAKVSDHEILKQYLRRRLACARTLWLLDLLIDASNPQEPVLVKFYPDSDADVARRKRGLPIGNLTSQFFANVYMDGLDHLIKEVLRVPGYVRYVDDFALFGDSVVWMSIWCNEVREWLIGRRLLLHPTKTQLLLCAEDAEFLGFVLQANGQRRLKSDNVHRFAQRLSKLRQSYKRGELSLAKAATSINSWCAHAAHANSFRLKLSLFQGRMFDPTLEPEHPLHWQRVLRGGSWNNNPNNLRSANRNRNTTDNRNNNNGFRLASTLINRTSVFMETEAGIESSRVLGK